MKNVNPRFPIYILSKSRWDKCLTAHMLDSINVPYRVVVEEEQFDQYANVLGAERLLILPKEYIADYESMDPAGDAEGISKGSGPARNFIWDHSISEGHDWHWIMDDNIYSFYRLHENKRLQIGDGLMFSAMEDFVLRYKNIAQAGPHYKMFLANRTKWKPYTTNSRIFSCILIRNDIPFRWRCRYNEDVELSVRILKAGYCTILFNTFLQDKISTQLMTGGNTEAFYAQKGTGPKSELLASLHPDCTKVIMRYGRIHHHIDYRRWTQGLIRKDDYDERVAQADYKMKLVPRIKPAKAKKADTDA
jgi:hypothetical protein